MVRSLFCWFVLVALVPVASAQWVQTEGPVGVDFHKLAALSESEVIAATLHGTAFTFADGAWGRAPEVMLPQGRLYRQGDLWYQLADGVVLASADGGSTWTDADLPGMAIAVYETPEAFYAATETVVYSTTDGTTWEVFIPSLIIEIPVGGSTTTGLLDMRHFGVHEGIFLARGHVNGHVGLFRTEDGGTTWTRLAPAPIAEEFFSWDGVLYGYGCYSYRSYDDGLSWETIAQPTVEGATACFDYLAASGDVLLAQSTVNGVGQRFGVFRLDGDTWTRVHPTAGGLSTFGGTAFVVDEAGAHQTTDGGASWTPLPNDLIATTTVSQSLGAEGALALTEQKRLYRSEDLVTWTELAPITPAGLRANQILAVSGAVLAATEDGIYRSTDNGLTWVESDADITYHPFHIDRTARLATNGDMIVGGFSFGFAQQGQEGVSIGGMYRSDDGGQSWSSMNETFPVDDLDRPARVSSVAMNASTLVIYTNLGVFTSSDEGTSWTQSTGFPPPPAGIIRTLYAFGERFYAITYYGQLYESTDDGLTWHLKQEGIPMEQFFHDAHLFQLEDEIFLVINKDGTGGAYRLGTDAWELLGREMPSGIRFNGFEAHGDLVLAGTIDAGVWTVPAEFFLGPTVAQEATPATAYSLSAVYPNPTSAASRLTLTLGEAQPVRVEVLDVRGRRVAVLHEGRLPAGAHTVTLPAEMLRAGTYLVRIAGPHFADVRRVTVVR